MKIPADNLLRELALKKQIHKVTRGKERNYDHFGSLYCCPQIVGSEGEYEHPENVSIIAENISQYSFDKIQEFIREIQCNGLLEENLEEEIDELEDTKKQLNKRKRALKEENNDIIRREIEKEIYRLEKEKENLQQLGRRHERRYICKRTIPPAWYISYRSQRMDWGIHIVEPLMFVYTNEFWNISSLKNSDIPRYFYELCLLSVLEHETFHFAFNVFMDKCEFYLDKMGIAEYSIPQLYTDYSRDIYSVQYKSPNGAKEEGLASAWEYEKFLQGLSNTPARWELSFENSRDLLWKLMKGRDLGYRNFHQYTLSKHLSEPKMIEGCINLLRISLDKNAARKIDVHQSIISQFLPSSKEIQDVSIPLYVHRKRRF